MAGHASSPQSAEALETLCRGYWYPLYAFVRRHGHDVHAAQDLTQEFFARMLAKNYLDSVDPAKGRFRSFLLASLKHFLANEWDRANRQKRGGGCTVFSLDDQEAETHYQLEAANDSSAEAVFDRRWAYTVLGRVIGRLKAEFAEAGKAERFDRLKVFLTEAPPASRFGEVAAQLSLTENAVRCAVDRLRQRYAELFRAEIAHTVARPEDVEEEIRYLFGVLSQ
jgi:DNA-directed RNA polymerase specialized sigma24 family protein